MNTLVDSLEAIGTTYDKLYAYTVKRLENAVALGEGEASTLEQANAILLDWTLSNAGLLRRARGGESGLEGVNKWVLLFDRIRRSVTRGNTL